MTERNGLLDKIEAVKNLLEETYGIPRQNMRQVMPPLDELILTILSQNTNDNNSFKAFENLKKSYSSHEEILRTSNKELAEVIKIAGLGPTKADYIIGVLQWLMRERGSLDASFMCEMDTDEAIEKFTQLKGIGVKTIAVTLAFSCGKDLFPVDTHIFRVCKRLGLLPGQNTPEKAFYYLKELIPRGTAFALHMNVIRHGRETCHARRPDCDNCRLRELCEYFTGTT